jgi:hypothetical protein
MILSLFTCFSSFYIAFQNCDFTDFIYYCFCRRLPAGFLILKSQQSVLTSIRRTGSKAKSSSKPTSSGGGGGGGGVKENSTKKFTTKKNVKKVSNIEPKNMSVENRILMPDGATDKRKKDNNKDKDKDKAIRTNISTSSTNSNTENDGKDDTGEEEKIKSKVEGGGKREVDRNTKSGTRKPKVYTAPKSTTNSRARRSDQRKINSDKNKLDKDRELVLESPSEQLSTSTSTSSSASTGSE